MKNEKTSVGDAVPTTDDNELAELGVAAAAGAIRNGDITAESYATTLLQRARKYADLNSFITIDESAVLTAAEAADKARAAGSTAPLLGVPLGVKDSYLTRGLRTTFGVEILEGFTPTEDADVVTAIKDAGAIVFGKNNLVEMSYGLTGDNSRYGQVKNPYDTRHMTGGSSSGSGAAVAARIVAGSIRRGHGGFHPGARLTGGCRGLQTDHRSVVGRRSSADLSHTRRPGHLRAHRRGLRADRPGRHQADHR